MTQADLFGVAAAADKPAARGTRLPAPWRRTDNNAHGKIGATYHHPAGYLIQHCGHPTALWPYALYGPDGAMILAPNGRAWRTLFDAAFGVERLLTQAGLR